MALSLKIFHIRLFFLLFLERSFQDRRNNFRKKRGFSLAPPVDDRPLAPMWCRWSLDDTRKSSTPFSPWLDHLRSVAKQRIVHIITIPSTVNIIYRILMRVSAGSEEVVVLLDPEVIIAVGMPRHSIPSPVPRLRKNLRSIGRSHPEHFYTIDPLMD
jgi:hypothetical protein